MMPYCQNFGRRRFPHKVFAIIVILGCLMQSGWAQNTYHTNRVFNKVSFTIPGVPTAFEVCNMAGQLTTAVGPTNVITNGFYATERQSVALGHASSAQAWTAVVVGYPSNSCVHTNCFFDNAGWVKGVLQTEDGKWGGYIWLLQNTVNFTTSVTNVWVSMDGVTNVISKVLVGTIGDYPAMENVEDTGPTVDGLTNNPPSGGSSDDMVYTADFTAYYELTNMPSIWIEPLLTNVCVNFGNVNYTLSGNSIVPNGVGWSITPDGLSNGSTLTGYPSNAVVNVGGIATSYVVRATANENTNIFGLAKLNVLKVEITEPNENPVTDNNFTFDSASPGVCNVPATGTCGIPSENQNLEWTLTGISGSTKTSNPNPAKGSSITYTYTTLPSANSQFGAKTLTLTHPVSGCQDTQTVYIFFTEAANNNPGGSTPNWYYYWKQTTADYGTHSWEAGAGTGMTRFEGGQWKAFLRNANEYAIAGTWNNAEGIDFFAHMCRHEDRHRLDFVALWGATSDRVAMNDVDNDYLPDNQEATLVSGHPYSNTNQWTYPDTFDYGQDPLRDCEDYCLRRQASWINGSADTNDWANPGHQNSQ